MGIIRARKLGFDYVEYREDEEHPEVTHALQDIDLDIEEGSFIAILGHNGCGKSTLAKHINALLVPTDGTMWIDSMNTAEGDDLWKIRQEAGMVFQNPDNQIIATVVEEDIAFGPENIGVPTEEIWARVDRALEETGMVAYRKHAPNRLSGGQKQRVGIAGVMAMRPKCIVLDEPTAMLDPNGRREVIHAVRDLNAKEGVTVILITHYMEEAISADLCIVMDEGRIVMQGKPGEVFSQVERIKELRLDVPQVTDLAHELIRAGVPLNKELLRKVDLEREILQFAKERDALVPGYVAKQPSSGTLGKIAEGRWATITGEEGEVALENVSYTYSNGTSYEVKALDGVDLVIPRGQFVGVIGHTGSGKSTLVQQFNALMQPSGGKVYFSGQDIWAEGYDRRALRFRVGMVFQYPEHQLFETDVITDVCFGPKNQGLSKEECIARAKIALEQVGIPEDVYDNSPFELSGGQKRRVAIAGVLAMEPEVLILDEPTAGLDPKGRDDIFAVIERLQETRNMTIILVSHSMEDVARYADRLVVMNEGKKAFDGAPKEVFAHYQELEAMGLAAPHVTYICHELAEAGLPVDVNATTVEEARDSILSALSMRGK